MSAGSPAPVAGADYEAGLHRMLGLTDDELERIRGILGRAPNRAELAMYSVMWSEHCSYKSSRLHLKNLPSSGPRVLMGPGEGAGVIEVDGTAVAIRIESHNHPSYVEPFQGAATGIGGVVRDVLSMGARPIALLDPLRFGPLPGGRQAGGQVQQRNRFLVKGVVSGISSYGNCIGVPTVGGEIVFDDCYSGNPLVNVMCIGAAPAGRLQRARAEGPGNAVLLLGSSTGRDGIGGVSVLASAAFEAGDEDKRPSVQVGDPFTEKLLIEACLALVEKGLVVGIQDLGGAGLCCATSESAANAGNGMWIDLDRVPKREPGMEPFEILTSESQERMLVVVRPGDVAAALALCDRAGLAAFEIGEVTATGRLEVVENGRLVADVPAASLGDGPLYDRPYRKPPAASVRATADPPGDLKEHFLRLVASPNIASKLWAWEQYDHQVMLGTALGPGHDAAVLRLPDSRSRIAVTTDGNGRWCFLDPYLGTMHTVAEAARNLSCVGAEPAAVTNCLNFGNPEVPEIMGQFVEAVRGLSDACKAFGTPVVSGNVSFYNQTGEAAIYPTPIIGMVGVLPGGVRPPGAGFKQQGDCIFLLGSTAADLGGSEYLASVLGRTEGALPPLDLSRESALQRVVRDAISRGLLSSAHDCSSGGLAAALAQSCVIGSTGARIRLPGDLEPHLALFSESASRVLISLPPENEEPARALAAAAKVPMDFLGRTANGTLSVEKSFDVPLGSVSGAYRSGFSRAAEPA